MDTRGEKGLDTTHSSVNHTKTVYRRRGLLHKRPELAKMACQALGIDPKDLTMKTKQEMHDPKKLKEANDLVFDHYLKRYNRKVTVVENKIKEFLEAEKIDFHQLNDHNNQRRYSSSGSHDGASRKDYSYRVDSRPDSINYPRTARPKSVRKNVDMDFDSNSSTEDYIEVGNNEIATNIIKNYKQKLERVQRQWEEKTKDFKNRPLNDPNKVLSHALRSQVERLHRSIEKAEKYAQSVIEFNNKREALREELQERDEKTMKLKKKFEKERQKTFMKNKEIFEDKMKEIKDQKRQFSLALKKNALKIKKRFEELEEKINKEEECRKQVVKSKSTEFIHKVNKAKEQKDAEYEDLYQSHKAEETRLQRHIEALKSERKMRCEENAKCFLESYEKAKSKRTSMSNEKDTKTIKTICKKFENAEQIREYLRQTLKKKSQENAEKEEIFKKNYKEVLQNKEYLVIYLKIQLSKRKHIKHIVQRYRKSQERIKEHQEEKLKTMALKQEVNNLRRLDQMESLLELKNLHEQRNIEIIEKERADALKLAMFKEQNQILSQARIDVDRRIKQKVDEMIGSAFRAGNKSVDLSKTRRTPSVFEL